MINRIRNDLMPEANDPQRLTNLQEQLEKLSEKLKSVVYTPAVLLEDPNEVFSFNKICFELKIIDLF